jgi:excinuclease ABC subunit C
VRGDVNRRQPDGTPAYESILLPADSHVLHLLQRVRDEAHRFAITYQSLLRGKRATTSLLDEIPGIGPATRKALIRKFGSVRGVRAATSDELTATVGAAKARIIQEHLSPESAPGTTQPADDMAVSEN